MNIDTMIAVKSGGLNGGVYRTTNGGSNWQLIWTNGTAANPTRIYMVNKNLGFHSTENLTYFRRTTNGGMNWTDINDIGFSGICFYDTLIGWKGSVDGIKKTTNGGLNWITQSHTWIYNFNCLDICAVNKDTVWFVGSSTYTNSYRGVIFVTTNGGYSWGYQLPDTSIHIGNYVKIRFTNKNNGWAYYPTTGVHTNTGGNDTTYITQINNQTVNSPNDYYLYQNYPNPFNSISKIKYQISKTAYIKIVMFDISGKELSTLVSERQSAGIYNVSFDGSRLSSGVYFYVLFVNSEKKDIRKMILVK